MKRKVIMCAIFNFLLDLVFPKFCLGCQSEGTWLCNSCFKKIKVRHKQCCPVCRTENKFGSVCNECQKNSNLNGLFVCCEYENEMLKKCIHFYKYQFVKELYRPLTRIIMKALDNNSCPRLANSIILPIPLHRKRIIERGYNQSALIAERIAKILRLPYDGELLTRSKYTEKQASLDKQDRQINVKSAFSVKNGFDFRKKNVIIVDDVATTLATLNASAKQLKEAGANQVWGLVIARGNFK